MYFVVALMLLIAAGCVWQRLMLKADGRKYSPAGHMAALPDGKMHVLAKGEGARVVLLAGWGCAVPSADFQPLSDALVSRGFRAVVVEKYGYGFSDDTDKPRAIDAVIDEMRAALADAGERPPYLLCGHSLAGTEVVRWACRYAGEIAGVITLDAPAPLCYTHVPLPPKLMLYAQAAFRACGLTRLMLRIPSYSQRTADKYLNGYRYLDKKLLPLIRAMQCKNQANHAVINEILALRDNCRIAGGELPKGIKQLMLIASDTKEKRYETLEPEQDEYIARNSPHVEIIEGMHNLQHFAPERIAELIAEEWKGADICADTSQSGC